jgi:uncharacterized protein (TIGR00730 family)
MNHTKKLHKRDLLEKDGLLDLIHNDHYKVAIFGSARLKPEDADYKEIVLLAQHLAEKWYDIVTWGGPGAMEAASQGHKLADKNNTSSTIGINIELPYEQEPNKYLEYSDTKTTFSARLDTFMLLSNAFIIWPGGVGTLLEFFYTWQLMQVNHICKAPIILWWEQYHGMMDYFHGELVYRGFLDVEEANLVIQTDSRDTVIKLVDMARDEFRKEGNKACLNIDQYISGAKNLGLIK